MTPKEVALILLNLSHKNIRREESAACKLAAALLTDQWEEAMNYDRERINPKA